MKKHFLFIVSILLLGFSSVAAQTNPVVPKTVSGGVLNSKARNLVKPAYPPAAKAVNAEGAVNVQVTIDEEGNVVSAQAVSGHPLLRVAAQQAALESKFSPTMLSGQPVKVTGVIVYNFVADVAPGWFKVGYDLSALERGSTLVYMNLNALSKSLQPDWTAEKQQIDRLAEIKQSEQANNPPVVLSEKKVSENTEKSENGTTVKKMVTQRAVTTNNPASSEQTAIAQSLIAAMQGRLGSDETNLWQFNLGVNLSKALSQGRDFNERQNTLASIRQQIQYPPAKISAEALGDVQKIVSILEKQNSTDEDREQIRQIMPRLFKN